MELTVATNAWMALLVGIITSPHCLIMCGPLAFSLLDPPQLTASHSYYKVHLVYHCARVFSFSLIGMLAGAIGFTLLFLMQKPAFQFFPWVLVLFLVIFAFGIDRLIPKAPFARRLFSRVAERLTKLPKTYAGLLLGLMTPLLPCGPLYMVFWLALLSGSPSWGAKASLGFGVGTFPLMLIAGSIFSKFKRQIKPSRVYAIQRILALCAAFFLAWRLLAINSPFNDQFCCPW